MKLGEHIVSFVFHILFIAVIICLFVLLVIYRNEEPLRSRLFGPHICLLAILIESILQVIRHGLWFANSPSVKAINSIGFAILVISNPLEILSLFVYLIQEVRYALMRNIYQVMDREKETSRTFQIKFRLIKLFISKWIFYISIVVFYCLILMYYLGFSIGAGVLQKSLSEKATNRTTIAGSVSYLITLLILALCLITVFIWNNIIMVFKTESIRKQKIAANPAPAEQHRSKQNPLKNLVVLKEHFLSSDPLYFRLNSVLMMCCVLIGVTSFATGIASQYVVNTQYAWLALDLIYTILRIITFAGFILGIQIFVIGKKRTGAAIMNVDDNSETTMQVIVEIINHKYGSLLFEQYCRDEFSIENYLLIRELLDLHDKWGIMSVTEHQQMIQLIFTTYIKRGSPKEVNIASSVYKQCDNLNTNCKTMSAVEQLKILKKLANSVFVNLGDTFSRFIDTQEWKNFKSSERLERELQDVALNKKKINLFEYTSLQE
jgi:hypothetical protein